MNDDRLDGLISPANAAILCNMLDIYSLNTLVTFLIELEQTRNGIAASAKRPLPKIGPKPAPDPTIEEQTLKAYAYALSRASNLYLVACRELGTILDSSAVSDLLFERTGWTMSVCNDWAERVLNDDQLTAVLKDEGIN